MIPDLTPAEIARFYGKVHVAGCGMLWAGPVNSNGYGRFEYYRNGRRQRILAHRLAYFLATGEDPSAAVVRHGCDTPPCVTPDCLEPGTRGDNTQDALLRGRLDTSGLAAYREARESKAQERIRSGRKTCRGCGVTKPLAEFSPNGTSYDGRATRCRVCRRVQRGAVAS